MASINTDLSDLRAFVAVAERGNFSAAALEIHLSQPALSRRIAKLEGALGVRLLERTTRRVDLTAFGRNFARRARELINEFDASLLGASELSARVAGEVTVACVPSAVTHFLPDVLRDFHARFPRILIRVVDQGASDGLSSVIRREADFGLNYIGAQEPEVEFRPVLTEPFVVACHHAHPLASRSELRWADLAGHDYISVARASGNRFVLDLALAGVPELPRPFCEVRHIMSVVSLVEAGVGIAVVPRLALPRQGHPLLTAVTLVDPAVTRTIGLVSRRGQLLSTAAHQFYNAILARGEDASLTG